MQIALALTLLAMLGNPGLHALARTHVSPLNAAAQQSANIAPSDSSELMRTQSEMRGVVERFQTDRENVVRMLPVRYSPAYRARLTLFYRQWQNLMQGIAFDRMSQDGKIDYILLRNFIAYALRGLDIENQRQAEELPIAPFAGSIEGLVESLARMETVDPQIAAETMNSLEHTLTDLTKQINSGTSAPAKAGKTAAHRAAARIDYLRRALGQWFGFYNQYDPMFTWWVEAPYKTADAALKCYADLVRTRLAGVQQGDQGPLAGDPIGREALLSELQHEMIPYTPEELVAIANKEYAWSLAEMKKASNAMGCGDDWKKALELVKRDYVAPGKQPQLIRDLAEQAIAFVAKNNLVTVPRLARETYSMEMMTPQRQLVSPFFTGGSVISVSYPTSGMTEEQKMMSLRGNNIHFCHATVFHELIPGHHLQGYMEERYRQWRSLFDTPFWVEGNAFYWELRFYKLGFSETPQDKIGQMFWRMHRSARIIFSLSFQLGTMTPKQCVDFLIDKVGHEPANAEAEVRRSIEGGYGPLYQCSYMLGGLQQMALHHDLVDSGKLTERAFNDSVLKENAIPIEMVRADLEHVKLTRDYSSKWKFYGDVTAAAAK